MSDPRTWTPSRGIRPAPRDTVDILKELGLPPRELARELRSQTPAWREWLKLVPIYAILAGGGAAVAVKWDRSVSDRDLAAKVGEVSAAAARDARALELELVKVKFDALVDRMTLSASLAKVELRLGELESKRRRAR